MFFIQHCKPAVDEETFQKLVERQYELLRKERLKGFEELKPKVEENLPNGTTGNSEPTQPTASAATEENQQVQQEEVSDYYNIKEYLPNFAHSLIGRFSLFSLCSFIVKFVSFSLSADSIASHSGKIWTIFVNNTFVACIYLNNSNCSFSSIQIITFHSYVCLLEISVFIF